MSPVIIIENFSIIKQIFICRRARSRIQTSGEPADQKQLSRAIFREQSHRQKGQISSRRSMGISLGKLVIVDRSVRLFWVRPFCYNGAPDNHWLMKLIDFGLIRLYDFWNCKTERVQLFFFHFFLFLEVVVVVVLPAAREVVNQKHKNTISSGIVERVRKIRRGLSSTHGQWPTPKTPAEARGGRPSSLALNFNFKEFLRQRNNFGSRSRHTYLWVLRVALHQLLLDDDLSPPPPVFVYRVLWWDFYGDFALGLLSSSLNGSEGLIGVNGCDTWAYINSHVNGDYTCWGC